MLEAMRELALIELWNALEGKRRAPPDDPGDGVALVGVGLPYGGKRRAPPEDLGGWFREKRQNDGGSFFPYLVESPGKIDTFYTLSADPDDRQVALLEGADLASLGSHPMVRLPYIQTAPNSPDLGPILKRSLDNMIPKPKPSMLKRLLKRISKELPVGVSAYGREASDVCSRPKLRYGGVLHEQGKALVTAMQIIPEKKTVFLAYRDNEGRLPGQVQPYVDYLRTILGRKYTTQKALPHDGGACPLCGAEEVRVYPNALFGAGLNLANVNRLGAFPGVSLENAHLGYALCLDCADLLYVFKNTLLPRLTTSIAGERALVLPRLHCHGKAVTKAVYFFEQYLASLNAGNAMRDIEARKIPRQLGDGAAVSTVDIVWATFGNKMENVRGQVLDVLPSRLAELDKHAKDFAKQGHPFAPAHRDESFRFDLNLSFLRPLFRRPGGKAAGDVNASANLFRLKRALAEAVYRGTPIPCERFWDEIMTTAQWYLKWAAQQDHPEIGLLHEGYSEKKKTTWLTVAGWTRHLALALEYFRSLGLTKKETETMAMFEPSCEKLRPFLCMGGLNSDDKAFAFVLGVLFGEVVYLQGAVKKVNVAANALTWLKRLTLTGKDLPELFVKVRGKLLTYEADRFSVVREVIQDLAALGCRLGTAIDLNQVETCYFILLGQAVCGDVFGKDQTAIEAQAASN